MQLIFAKNIGFCFGVQNAVNIAEKAGNAYTYGHIIHNEHVIEKLRSGGITAIEDLSGLKAGDTLILRSHGAPKSVYEQAEKAGVKLIDATCPFVKKIHDIVRDMSQKGYHIVIAGKASHPEVIGIRGWCKDSVVVDEKSDLSALTDYDKICVVAQTTSDIENFSAIIKKIVKLPLKTVEIFNTICYTTIRRQIEAERLAAVCDAIVVIGSKTSSNTNKLFAICAAVCENCYLIQNAAELQNINFSPYAAIGVTAGASTPSELIMEVKEYMSQQFEEVQNKEFIEAVEESLMSYKEGKRVKGTVIGADEKGIHVNIGGKKDGLVPKDEVVIEGEYNPADYAEGTEIEAIIISKQDTESGCVLLSKKRVDQIKEGDKIVETIRDGAVFELVADKVTKGGLLGKLGTYTVFIPASQIREGFVKDLKQYVGKKLRLTALEIEDDEKRHKIVASQRKVLEEERKEREDIFWANVQPNVIVHGKVKRVTNFGAFVSVDGFDCLAHIVDLSWNHIKKVEDVLTIGESYDFLVLAVDREKGRVSLGYKQLQQHPFIKCIEEHPVGSICHGKVVSIVPFGAFVELAPGVEGLVHVSEAAHTFVKNINEVVKVGDEVDVMILAVDEAARKITLSIKACSPDENAGEEKATGEAKEPRADKKPKRAKSAKPETEDGGSQWNEDIVNNPFADLLKDLGEDNN
jgi:4-hydroxy-3-methylbut-2-enyl diphosphate reductase